MKWIKWALVLVALVAAGIFLPRVMEVKFFFANLPAYFTVERRFPDIDYGSKHGLKLDVYGPAGGSKIYPVIVFFHGGKWRNGRKDNYEFVAAEFIKRGYVVVVPEVAQFPEHHFADWQEDAAKAVAWTHREILKFNGDSNRLFLLGHSSGGQIAALVATDERYLAKEGGSRAWIKAYAGLAAPYDFTPGTKELKAIFKDTGENYSNIRVTNFIDGKQPPMFMGWGRLDDAIGEDEMLKVEDAIKKKGGQYQLKYYDDGDHISLVSSFAPLSDANQPLADDVDAFFKSVK